MADYETSTYDHQNPQRNTRRPYYGFLAREIRDQKIDGTRTFVLCENLWGETFALLLDPPDVDTKQGLVRVTINHTNEERATIELPKHASNGRCQIEVHRENIKTWPHQPQFKEVSALTNPTHVA